MPEKRLFTLGVALAIAACSKPNPPPPSASPTAASAPGATARPSASAAAAPSANPNGLTGVLSEAEFKKLHELSGKSEPTLHGQMVQLSSSRAYLSLPANAKPPLPALVVIHEWWGLNEHIEHWSDRLAADGYAALAVDLYGGKVAKTPDEAMAAMKAVDEATAKKVLLEAFAFLRSDPKVQASRRGAIGWCFGGKWSLELALATPDIDAAVVYYGHVTTDEKRLSALKAPLLGIFGNLDKGIAPSMVNDFEAALKKSGARATILRYDAEHAFANPSNARYDAVSAEKAWAEARRFLARNVKQQP
jgi:carboxymethylenebutenolidase